MSDEMTAHHSPHSAGGNASNLLPYSILIAALILGGSMVYSANALGSSLSNLTLTTAGSAGQGTGGTLPTAPNPTNPAPAAPANIPVQELIGNSPSIGEANAPITMVEFSDFQCPFCSRWFNDAYPQIKQNWVNTGKLRIVFKDFPLSFHPNAQKASEAAQCALKQGKFWEMHDSIFTDQENILVADLKSKAKALGLNESQFNSCLDSGETAPIVKANVDTGSQVGVSGTPSFEIGAGAEGTPVVGACPYATFDEVLKAETEGKNWFMNPDPQRGCEVLFA